MGIILAVVVSHLIARTMGTSPQADAFILGRRLITSLSEALNQIVVIVFIPLIAAQTASGMGFARIMMRSGGAAIVLGTALAAGIVLFAPHLVDLIAGGFAPETSALAIQVITLMALALPTAVATIAFSSYCNVKGNFAQPSLLRQLPRVAIILALVLSTAGAAALPAAASFAAAHAAVAVVIFAIAVRLNRAHKEIPAAQPRKAALHQKSAAALILALSAVSVIWLETSIAADLGQGELAMLDYGQRLGALGGNTVAMALGLVVFADMSRRAAQGETTDLARRISNAGWVGLALLAPLQIGVIVNAEAICNLIVGYGKLSDDALPKIALIVRFMALAPVGALILRMMLIRVLTDGTLPVIRFMLIAMGLDFLTRYVLFETLTARLGLPGIAIALILAPVVPICALILLTYRARIFDFTSGLRPNLKLLAISLSGCVAIWLGAVIMGGLAGQDKLGDLVRIGVSGFSGLLVLAAGFGLLRPKIKLK